MLCVLDLPLPGAIFHLFQVKSDLLLHRDLKAGWKTTSAARAEHMDILCVGNLADRGADAVESAIEIIGIWLFLGGAASLCAGAQFVWRQEHGS